METRKLKLFTLFILSILLFGPVSTQNKFNPENLNLLNGKTWVPNPLIVSANPFFQEERKLMGTITFQGDVYPNQQFAYDIVLDELILIIVNPLNDKIMLVLNKDFIEKFSVDGLFSKSLFVKGREIHEELDSSGFYQILNSDNLSLIVKREKIKKVESSEAGYKYITENRI